MGRSGIEPSPPTERRPPRTNGSVTGNANGCRRLSKSRVASLRDRRLMMSAGRRYSRVSYYGTAMVLASLSAVLQGCGDISTNPTAQDLLEGSRLQSCLLSDEPDPIYCAMCYICQSGGPDLAEPFPESDLAFRARGKRALEWVRRREASEIRALVQGFPAYTATWSPQYWPEIPGIKRNPPPKISLPPIR